MVGMKSYSLPPFLQVLSCFLGYHFEYDLVLPSAQPLLDMDADLTFCFFLYFYFHTLDCNVGSVCPFGNDSWAASIVILFIHSFALVKVLSLV